MLKKKSIYTEYLLTFTKFFPQADLIWSPKSDVPIIGICCPNGPKTPLDCEVLFASNSLKMSVLIDNDMKSGKVCSTVCQ